MTFLNIMSSMLLHVSWVDILLAHRTLLRGWLDPYTINKGYLTFVRNLNLFPTHKAGKERSVIKARRHLTFQRKKRGDSAIDTCRSIGVSNQNMNRE